MDSLLNRLFFGLVSIQKRFDLTRLNFRRDPDAGTRPNPLQRLERDSLLIIRSLDAVRTE